MITLGELLREDPSAAQERVIPIRPGKPAVAIDVATDLVRAEQLHVLVQQLFFRPQAGLVRNVGFIPVDEWTTGAALCVEIARALGKEGRYDVGLIDATSDGLPLQAHLQIPAPTRTQVTWSVAPGLSFVPRQSWWQDAGLEAVTDENLEQLGELMAEFDYSIVCCPPVSWLAARVAQSCDGVVLVLTANKTRRLVASEVKERLNKAQVPVLGTILVDRRFPIPRGLYRTL